MNEKARNEMTREEAVKLVKEVTGMSLDWDDAHYEALQMAIKALEKEPCEDAVSRKTVLNTLNRMDSVLDEDRTVETYKELLIACYNDLPPVTLTKKCIATVKFSKEDMQKLINEKMKDIVVERKKGKWIPCRAKYDNVVPIYECSICHKDNGFEDTNYCPNCGAEMESKE